MRAAAVIGNLKLQGAAKYAAGRVDLGDRQLGGLHHRGGDHAVGPAKANGNADLDRLLGREAAAEAEGCGKNQRARPGAKSLCH